jgi:hypothetical protein
MTCSVLGSSRFTAVAPTPSGLSFAPVSRWQCDDVAQPRGLAITVRSRSIALETDKQSNRRAYHERRSDRGDEAKILSNNDGDEDTYEE